MVSCLTPIYVARQGTILTLFSHRKVELESLSNLTDMPAFSSHVAVKKVCLDEPKKRSPENRLGLAVWQNWLQPVALQPHPKPTIDCSQGP